MSRSVSLKREIGLLGSFSMGFADVGADVFLAIGIVALYAAGFSPLAFLIASICYITTGLVYAELSELYPYAGGAQVYGTKAGGDILGFLMGWAILLDYVLNIGLFSIASAGYLSFIFPWLKGTININGIVISRIGLAAFTIVIGLIIINIIGIKESSDFNIALVILTIVTELLVLSLGFLFAFNMDNFIEQLNYFGNVDPIKYVDYTGLLDVKTENFIYGVTLAMSSYIGIESIAQAAEETRNPWKHLHRAFKIGIVAVVFFTLAFSILALGVLGWETLSQEAYNPIASIASKIPVIGGFFAFGVAFVAFAINMVSTNTGVIGVSRVVYSMSRFDMLPKLFSKLHPRRATPYISIIIFSLIGGALALTGELHFVASLYNFGALLSYLLVNYSHIKLRNIDSEAYRNWKTPLNFKFKGREYSIVAIIGFLSTGTLFSLVVLYHPDGRILGSLWMALGLALFILYRKIKGQKIREHIARELIPPATPHLRTAILINPGIREEGIIQAIITQLPKIHRIFLLGRFELPKMKTNLEIINFIHSFEDELRELVEELTKYGYRAEYHLVIGDDNILKETIKDLHIDQIAIPSPKRGRRKTMEKRKGNRIYHGVEIIHLYL
ncbi:MAG TPA: amino acid permease [Thermoprotei archaeon]|nr:amino acid permease [Thermoprotei archaeon]